MVKSESYVPGCGDIVWINFDPQSGHEQAGRRPALVLSPQKYNCMKLLNVKVMKKLIRR
jgi:mRNA interferase MazF